MLNRERRSQFTIIIATGSIDEGTELRNSVSKEGYEVFLFTDETEVLKRAKEAVPHIIVFSMDMLESDLNTFTQSILDVNNEVLLMPIVDAQEAEALLAYRQYNYIMPLVKGACLPARILWAVEQTCTQLYLTYQNEQVINQLQQSQTIIKQMGSELEEKNMQIGKLENQAPVIQHEGFDVSPKLQEYQDCHSKEDMIRQLYTEVNQKFSKENKKIYSIYFKYLPTVHSFVATQGLGVDFENIRGVGSQLTEKETQNVAEILHKGRVPGTLQALMKEAFDVQDFVIRPLFVHRQLDGLFIFWSAEGSAIDIDFTNEYLLFSLLYQNLHLTRRNDLLDNLDPVSELFNRDTYMKKLHEEIARARRLQKPVTVVKFSIDHYSELGKKLGSNNRDIIFRSIAMIIRKTSRANDISCRTQENEISLILPHCGKKGGALRAERLRRTIENHSFSISGERITVSSGVSEYPTLSTDVTDLEASASQALQFIIEKGGNKVCLYKPMQEFKPDFEAKDV